MKIEHLHLAAFGPFTEVIVDFAGGAAPFHLVYGPNEAGKSSALRALRGLLFGIPVRTADNFVHANPHLRVGGRLVRSDGAALAFVRRKGQSKTLRGPDGQALLDDAALAPFLGGVGQELFEQMFAIGHEDLVRGGQEIVAGGGSVGQALFAAGAGLIRLQDFRRRLEQNGEELFKPSGSKPRINQRVTLLKAARRGEKEALLPARIWQTHHQALATARTRLAQVQQRLEALKQAGAGLERVRRALPLIARKKELDAERAASPAVPDLPADFGDRRRRIESTRALALNDRGRALAAIEGLQAQLAALEVPVELLGHAAMVAELQEELGAFRKGQKDRPERLGRLRTLKKQAADKLAEIGEAGEAGDGRQAALPPTVVGEIQNLGQTFERLTTRREAARERQQKLATRIAALRARQNALPPPVDTTALALALQAAQEAGPLEKGLDEARAKVAVRRQALDNALARLGLWQGTAEALDRLPCPSSESVARFEEQFAAARRDLDTRNQEKMAVAADLAAVEAELQAIAEAHDVPSEADLEAARALRTDGWRLVRGRLEGRDPQPEALEAFSAPFEASAGLADTFETSVQRADHIADRLRREAEQVSRKGLLEAKRRAARRKLADLEAGLAEARTRQAELERAWQALWAPAGVAPLTPAEMRAWLSEVAAIRDKLADLAVDQARAGRLAAEKETLTAGLCEALTAVGADVDPAAAFSALVGLARARVAAQAELAAEAETLAQELRLHTSEKEEAETAIADLTRAFEDWQGAWGAAVSRIGLAADASPTVAAVVIDSLRQARALMDEAETLQKRVDGIDRDADAFCRQVEALVASLAPDLAGETPERAAALLNVRLTAARESQARKESLEKQLAAAEDARRAADKAIADAETLLAALCGEAQCTRPEELEAVEQRSREQHRQRVELQDLEARLRESSAGATVAAFIDEAESVAADSIAPRLERLAEEIATLETERSELERTIGTETAELKRMDGSDAAAALAEEAERLLAGLETDVAAYARTRIAAALLDRTIEQYRQKHQGPLIARAGELFARMTLGSFETVRAEYDEKGSPVLVGVRSANGAQVTVAGMSDGTADQLYLALRIASLEQYLASNEPLPFVVDDILLRFDDARAAATLQVLAALSAHTQVIFFTHHAHLVALAEKHLPADAFQKHGLG